MFIYLIVYKNWISSVCLMILVDKPQHPNNFSYWDLLNFLCASFNQIFLYIIGAFDVFLISFSQWINNLNYIIISFSKLDDINSPTKQSPNFLLLFGVSSCHYSTCCLLRQQPSSAHTPSPCYYREAVDESNSLKGASLSTKLL